MTRKRKQFHFHQPSLTLQAPGEATRITSIIKRFKATGLLPEADTPIYGDASDEDFTSQQYALAEAKSEFESLSPTNRSRFGTPVAYQRHKIKQLELSLAAIEAKQDEIHTDPKGTDKFEPPGSNRKSEESAKSTPQDSPPVGEKTPDA